MVVEVSDDDVAVDGSAFPDSVLPESDLAPEVPLSELLLELLLDDPESPLSDVIDEEAAPRLSVL